MDALIGHTGFVGANLNAQHDFDAYFNSRNIDEIRGRSFERIVHAGTPAVKWWANQNPEQDWQGIESALEPICTAVVEELVLISTIDVVPPVQGADESFDCRSQEIHAYGRHRLRLEEALSAHFDNVTIVRLPALFGPGLKKNVLFDLMTDNMLEKINPRSRFQYYDLTRLWSDIERVIEARVSLVHFVTEPIATQAILSRFFPGKVVGQDPMPEGVYDFSTRHADLFGGQGGYLCNADQVLDQMGRFLAKESNKDAGSSRSRASES